MVAEPASSGNLPAPVVSPSRWCRARHEHAASGPAAQLPEITAVSMLLRENGDKKDGKGADRR